MAAPVFALGQTNMVIYSDSLVNGWWNGSYWVTSDFTNASPVHSGNYSISAAVTQAWGGIQLGHASMTNSAYASISFWLNGGPSGGQRLQMYGQLSTGVPSTRYQLATPLSNTWQQYVVPLSALGVANATNFTGFAIQDSAASTEPTFYLDDIQLEVPSPPLRHVTINAEHPIRSADARWFGLNVAIWDDDLDTSQTVSLLHELGVRFIRLPGGSSSDQYHWTLAATLTNTWRWPATIANFIRVITNASVNCQTVVTVNYGTGTPEEAAAWVAYCNAATTNSQFLGVDAKGINWQTAGHWASLRAAAPLPTDDGMNFLRISRTAPVGFRYWEIGNECYGTWEVDGNTVAYDPYTYALRATNYIGLMKAVDPAIKIGVVAAPGEDSYSNNTNHPAKNPRTLQTHNGWTPVLLTTLGSLGVTPDFLVHHYYPQYGGDNDATLLQSTVNWASDASNLRQRIVDYLGGAGTNVELLMTENNSDSGTPGRQSTSLVDGLYLADSLAQLMKTEFNSFMWWDLRDWSVTNGDFSASLYGWRTNGDLGMVDGLNTFFPAFYCFKLMGELVGPGDTIVAAASDSSLLSVYSARRLNGSLTLLAINKDPSNTFTGLVSVAGFVPTSSGTAFSYGIAQDNAAATNADRSLQDIAATSFSGDGTNFSYIFPPYSATVLSLPPAPAKLVALQSPTAASQFVFQIQGQVGVPYVLQSSTNLITWRSVSTNTLPAATLNITNYLDPSLPAQFWRAIWQP